MKKIFIIVLSLCTICLTSCKDWLDINVDPNSVSVVGDDQILPSIEMNTFTLYSMAHVLGSYISQQWAVKTGGPNTMAIAQWNTQEGTIVATLANRIYQYSYIRIINNCKALREQALANNAAGDYLAASTMRAFAYIYLADMFGEIPYSEAENTAITAPKYDDGKDVYAGVVKDLTEALKLVNGSELVCNNMLFLGSNDVNNWIKFANSLLFRILMRENAVVDVKAQLAELAAADNFITSDVAFASSLFANEAGKDNPVYDNYVRAVGDAKANRSMDICAHFSVLAAMKDVNDARIPAKFNKSVDGGAYNGNILDTQQSIEKTAGYVNENSFAEPVINYNTPVTLMTAAEMNFLLAEYYAKVAPNATKAEACYKAAIDASFKSCGVEGASDIYKAGATYAWNASKAEEIIGIQKWVALACVDGFESWCEMRRTGYPAFGPKTGAEIYKYWSSDVKGPDNTALVENGYIKPGCIFTPINAEDIAKNTYLGRFMYPTSSKSTNSNSPAQKDKADKVFWAK